MGSDQGCREENEGCGKWVNEGMPTGSVGCISIFFGPLSPPPPPPPPPPNTHTHTHTPQQDEEERKKREEEEAKKKAEEGESEGEEEEEEFDGDEVRTERENMSLPPSLIPHFPPSLVHTVFR